MSFMANASKVNLISRKTLASNFVYQGDIFSRGNYEMTVIGSLYLHLCEF